MTNPLSAVPDEYVAAVRAFNRLYTRRIGALREGLLHSPYSLTQARIMFELAQADGRTASDLGRELGLDAGSLSRTLTTMEGAGLIERNRAAHDGRQRLLTLTAAGREAFALLDSRSRDEVAELLTSLSEPEQARLLKAMQAISGVLDHSLKYANAFFLRAPEPGDLGWVTHRHGALYAQQYGWDASFETLVAGIVLDYAQSHDPACERCWIAESGGRNVGSVFLMRHDDHTAKLRLLLVEPEARGSGLGTRLVEACISFARQAGYHRITLWTNSVLTEARCIYSKTGFQLVAEAAHHSFGHDLMGETWELAL